MQFKLLRSVLMSACFFLTSCVQIPDISLGNQALAQGKRKEALWHFQQLAEKGIPEVQSASRDKQEQAIALYWYRQAALKIVHAQTQLGKMLVRTQPNGNASLIEAEKLFKTALAAADNKALPALMQLYVEHQALWPHVKPETYIAQAKAQGLSQASMAQIELYRLRGQYSSHLVEIEKTCQSLLAVEPMCYAELVTVQCLQGNISAVNKTVKATQAAFKKHQIEALSVDKVARALVDASNPNPQPLLAKSLLEMIAPTYPVAWRSLAQLQVQFPFLGDAATLKTTIDTAIATGNMEAHLLYGSLLMKGKVFPTNPNEAQHHLSIAAPYLPKAEYLLGLIYKEGLLGEAEPRKAFDLLLSAARRGSSQADMVLAHMYSDAKGVRPQLGSAWVFASLALEQQHAGADLLLASLNARLPPLAKQKAIAQLATEKAYRNAFALPINAMNNEAPLPENQALLSAIPLAASVVDTGLQSKISVESLDDADLGTATGGTLNAVSLDIKPWIHWQRNQWRAYGMAELFGSTETVEYESSAARPESNGFVGLREAWVDYTGLTQYPGAYLRTGLQKVRSPEGLWWDTDIEAAHWVFNTTLIESGITIAQRFNLYRSDENDVAYKDKDRRHLFGELRYQWLPGHWIGSRFHHLRDGKTPDAEASLDENINEVFSNLQWFGLDFDSNYYRSTRQNHFNYALSAVWMNGTRKSYPGSALPENISGEFLEALLRYELGEWQLGTAIAISSGGLGTNEDNRFMQTGLESNRSAFTGTRARLFRFGETYRATLGNLNVYTLFSSFTPSKDSDLSLVFHSFERRNNRVPVQSAISASLINGESNLGQEIDLVFSRYLNNGVLPSQWAVEDSAYFRIRGGIFTPERAYANNVDNTVLHVTGEVIWLF